jgi:hypothetical protein
MYVVDFFSETSSTYSKFKPDLAYVLAAYADDESL